MTPYEQLTPHQKAARTRAARQAFMQAYGETTFNIVRRVIAGQSSSQIATALGVSRTSVITTVGNYTRGIYANHVNECRFGNRS